MVLAVEQVIAVVLAGGTSSRMLGADKLDVAFRDRALLSHTISGLARCGEVVVVGPVRTTVSAEFAVTFVREDPPGGGPAAAVAAALDVVSTDFVFLAGGDMPFAGQLLPELLRQADGDDEHEAWVFVDEESVAQSLGGLYRTAALRRVTGAAPVANSSLKRLLAQLNVLSLVDLAGGRLGLVDIDTPDDLANARELDDERRRGAGHMLDDWTKALAAELGLDVDLDVALILDLAKDAAHGVARPAAPLTTFLVGYAAARAGGTMADIEAATDTARLLATRWESGSAEQP